MISVNVSVPISATSVAALIKGQVPAVYHSSIGSGKGPFRVDIVIQAPTANSNNVFMGGQNTQDGFLIAGGTSGWQKLDLNDVYIKGSGGDSIIFVMAIAG